MEIKKLLSHVYKDILISQEIIFDKTLYEN